jgi:hypothetical protein
MSAIVLTVNEKNKYFNKLDILEYYKIDKSNTNKIVSTNRFTNVLSRNINKEKSKNVEIKLNNVDIQSSLSKTKINHGEEKINISNGSTSGIVKFNKKINFSFRKSKKPEIQKILPEIQKPKQNACVKINMQIKKNDDKKKDRITSMSNRFLSNIYDKSNINEKKIKNNIATTIDLENKHKNRFSLQFY